MLFSSLIFLFAFLPFVLLGNWILPTRARNYFLLLASLVFYAWGEPKFVLVMITSIVANYLLAVWVDRKQRGSSKARAVLVLALIINLSILFIFKYLNFAVSNIDHIVHDLIPQTQIPLPIGISFFTFQALSYVIDTYRGTVKVQKNPFYVGLYISLFPQLIAGPIVRYSTIEAQILSREVTLDGFSEGVRRFIIGLGKKVILANNLALIADEAFSLAAQGDISVSFAWLGSIAYTLQIYFDFSGYSDMAIGLGRMLGFRFLENFNYPYISKSITEFWRRWHMSLSSWLRDYIYIPLGGSRVERKSTLIRNLFIVWLLTGIWHGANWTFILWGLFYFVLLTFEKLFRITEKFKNSLSVAFYRVTTLLLVNFGWVLFRAENLADAKNYFMSMIGIAGNEVMDIFTEQYLGEYWVILCIAVIYSCAVFKLIKERLEHSNFLEKVVDMGTAFVYPVIFLLSVSYLVTGAYNPFIYFNF